MRSPLRSESFGATVGTRPSDTSSPSLGHVQVGHSWDFQVRSWSAFCVSAVLYHVGLWGLGKGMEFSIAGGFFLYMGVGVIMEEKTTGLRVRGFLGWSWAMLWTLLWGMPMLDGVLKKNQFVNDLSQGLGEDEGAAWQVREVSTLTRGIENMKKYKAKTVLNYVERIYVAQVEVTVWFDSEKRTHAQVNLERKRQLRPDTVDEPLFAPDGINHTHVAKKLTGSGVEPPARTTSLWMSAPLDKACEYNSGCG
ncbi:hypothetical protein BGW80DRAFT_1444675 [Lactifluus volemus]|nr:hypothetical protein BGW80DRAFT_1444675 [Lactifluus volemus]